MAFLKVGQTIEGGGDFFSFVAHQGEVVAQIWVIGQGGRRPWHLPADLAEALCRPQVVLQWHIHYVVMVPRPNQTPREPISFR